MRWPSRLATSVGNWTARSDSGSPQNCKNQARKQHRHDQLQRQQQLQRGSAISPSERIAWPAGNAERLEVSARRPVASRWAVRRGWRWLVVLGCLLLAMRPSAYGRTPQALKLEIETGQKPVSPERTTPSVAMLVLNSMPEARPSNCWPTRWPSSLLPWDKRKNPLFVSFDDEERSVVHELIAQTMPAFSAAASLAAGSWPFGAKAMCKFARFIAALPSGNVCRWMARQENDEGERRCSLFGLAAWLRRLSRGGRSGRNWTRSPRRYAPRVRSRSGSCSPA